MSKKVCIICLVCEATTRLFCMQAAQNEDARRYECLTGIKLKCPAFICQRCSIDLGNAANLKQKALESAKMITPSINQFRVPANLNSPAKIHSPLNGLKITPILTQSPLNFSPSSKTALPLSCNMSRTDKIMSSASIISSTIVNPPMDMSKITDLFKTNPNISVIKTKPNEDENKGTKDPSKDKEQIPKDENEQKAAVNYNSRITKRRKTVCAENFYDLQKKAESQAGRKLASFQPTILVDKNKIKTENDKIGTRQQKASQKRQAQDVIEKDQKKQTIDESSQEKGENQPQNKYMTRNRAVKSQECEYQYWVKSKAEGYKVETFKSLESAKSYLEKLPADSTYGPLSDD